MVEIIIMLNIQHISHQTSLVQLVVYFIFLYVPGMGNITFYNDAPPYMKELHNKSMSIHHQKKIL